MYLTASSAAWRYSGNVTGPDSRLSSPSVIGVPDAAFGVPRAAEGSAVLAALAFEPPEGVEELDLSLDDPPPAATSARPASAPIHCLLRYTVLSWIAGCQAVATAASPR